jgi:hypothetical protein
VLASCAACTLGLAKRIRAAELAKMADDMEFAPKPCVTCGRSITWRKKWARDWERVRHCSEGCRRRLDRTDEALQRAIVELLAGRPAAASICPSEAARAVAVDWQPLMERARQAARRLVAAGAVVITQGGRVVDPSTAKGPIRIRRR